MSESTTVTRADFLLARIAEDEAAARRAPAGGRGWRYEDNGSQPDGSLGVVWDGIGQAAASHGSRWSGQHIARWDPIRVLAECEAKRRIVSHMQIVAGIVGPRGDDARAVLTWLAMPYADHTDFREEWRP